MRARVQLALAAAAVLLSAADTYVVILALPDMMAGVGLGLTELQRGAPIVTSFLLGYVVVLPLAGRVSDIVGRIPVIVACLGLFAVGSLVTASAGDLTVAVIGRGLQGLGAGGLVPPTLALVADTWPARRRAVPLGVVGAAQEVGSVAGPLLGAVILVLAGWRAIFWVNLVAGLVLAVALAAGTGRRNVRARHLLASALAAVAAGALALLLRPPQWLATDVTLGEILVPLAGGAWTSPLALLTTGLAVAAIALGPALPAVRALAGVDLLGALLLGLALAGIVLTFAGAEVSRSPVDDRWPFLLGGSALAVIGFWGRQARADRPLIQPRTLRAPGAWGALLVNLLVGAALVAVLVNVPIFARVTRYPDSQIAAALVLVQFLVALPLGALAGGWLAHRGPPRLVAAAGMALAAAALTVMAMWDERALWGAASTVTLVVAGLGFGLAIAPVNAVLLSATPAAVHGLASALAVLTRTMGMLVGLSALTAIGLRVFYQRQERIGSPLTLCPDSPTNCPAYAAATQASLLAEQQVIFLGAALCAGLAALAAGVLLRRTTAVTRFSGGDDRAEAR